MDVRIIRNSCCKDPISRIHGRRYGGRHKYIPNPVNALAALMIERRAMKDLMKAIVIRSGSSG